MPRRFFTTPIGGRKEFQNPIKRLLIPAARKEEFLCALEHWLIDKIDETHEDLKTDSHTTMLYFIGLATQWLQEYKGLGSPRGMGRSKLGGESPWEDEDAMRQLVKILQRLYQLGDGKDAVAGTDESPDLPYRSSSKDNTNLASSVSGQIAPVAIMTCPTNLDAQPDRLSETEEAEGDNDFSCDDEPMGSPEMADIDAANDRESDSDFRLRKSDRQKILTKKALQLGSTKKAQSKKISRIKASPDDDDYYEGSDNDDDDNDDNNDDDNEGNSDNSVSSESFFPPGFDRGRFPMKRRKMNPDKKRKKRSDSGLPKRQPSTQNAANSEPHSKRKANNVARDTGKLQTIPPRLNTSLANQWRPVRYNRTGGLTIDQIMNSNPNSSELSSLTTPDTSPCPKDCTPPSGAPYSTRGARRWRDDSIPTQRRRSSAEAGSSNIDGSSREKEERGEPSNAQSSAHSAAPATPNGDVSRSSLNNQPTQLVSGQSTSRARPFNDSNNGAAEQSSHAHSSSNPSLKPPSGTTPNGKAPAHPTITTSDAHTPQTIFEVVYFLVQPTSLTELERNTLRLSLDDLFTTIAAAVRRQHVESIDFTLYGLSMDEPPLLWQQSVHQTRPSDYHRLKRELRNRMKLDNDEKGTTKFDVYLKPKLEGLEVGEEVVMEEEDPRDRLMPF